MKSVHSRTISFAFSILLAFAGLSTGCVVDDGLVDENQAGAQQVPAQPAQLTPMAGDRLLISLPTANTASLAGGIIQTHFDGGSSAPLNSFPMDPSFEVPLYDDLLTPMQVLSDKLSARQAKELVDRNVTLAFATLMYTDGSVLPTSGSGSEVRVAIWREQAGDQALVEHFTTSPLTITQ